jgi:UDP-glucose 4-epimerase
VVAIFTAKMLQGEQPVINGDGEQMRDFVFVKDCARANLLALGTGATGIFNLASGKGTTVNELAAIIKEVTGSSGQPAYGPEKPGETRQIYLDASRAGEVLGWEPEVSLEEGLAETAAYFQKTGL